MSIREELIKQVEDKKWNVKAELWSDLSKEERGYFMKEQRKHKAELEEQRKSKVKEIKGVSKVREKKTGFANPMEYRPFKDNRKKSFEDLLGSFLKESKSKIHSIKTEFSTNREERIEKSENNKRREIALNKCEQK